jgi:hypothetical protein
VGYLLNSWSLIPLAGYFCAEFRFEIAFAKNKFTNIIKLDKQFAEIFSFRKSFGKISFNFGIETDI